MSELEIPQTAVDTVLRAAWQWRSKYRRTARPGRWSQAVGRTGFMNVTSLVTAGRSFFVAELPEPDCVTDFPCWDIGQWGFWDHLAATPEGITSETPDVIHPGVVRHLALKMLAAAAACERETTP